MASQTEVSKGGPGGFVAHGLAERVTSICFGLGLAISTIVLVSHFWLRASPALHTPALKPNAAFCILLISLGLGCLQKRRYEAKLAFDALVCGASALAIAGLTLIEYAFVVELGIDTLLIDLQGARMSTTTGIALVALASVTCLSALRSDKAILCQTLLAVAGLCAVLPIMGYLYRAPFLYGSAVAVAPGAAASCLSLVIGFVALRSEEGLWPLLIGDTAGSTLLRRGLPAVLVLPVLFGWLRLEAERHANLQLELSVALIASATALTFLALLVWCARWLRTHDGLRRAANDELREARDTLEQRVEERTRALKESEVELRRSAGNLLHAKEAAEAATRARSDFLARMSHEMRTPLNGVVGMLEIAMRSKLTPAQHGYVQTARSSADALLSLINDILDFSKMDAGKLSIETSTFRLRDALAQALCDSALAAHQKGLALTFSVDAALPECLIGDRQRLRQVITNLVSNAVKFTERGEVKLEVACGRRSDAEVELAIEVLDTGLGIAPDKQQEIFQAFTQGDETTTRRFGGTGLGLAISAQLVHLMGGTLTVESELGRGSCFSFRLGLGVDAEAERELDATRAAFSGQRALLVEPQADQRAFLSDVLLRWGIAVSEAVPAAAHRKLREARESQKPFAFLLLDDQAASSLGESYFENLRAVVGRRFPIILLIAPTVADHARDLRLRHASAQVTKPIVCSELFETIAGLLTGGARDDGSQHPSAPAPALRVLLAEDNEVNRRVACFLLQDVGYQVVAVEDGRKALAALQQQHFDVVLMDGHMPDMDGLAATRAIRQSERGTGRHVPIIALTAQAMKGDRERYIAAGMDGYLTKPFQSAQLYEAIRQALAKNPSSAVRAQLPDSPGAQQLTIPIYDRNAFLGRLRGMESVLRQMVQIFCEELPELRRALRSALDASESERIQKAAHKLAGALVTVGGSRAGESARAIENAARSADLANVEALFARLDLELAQLREAFIVEGDLATPTTDSPRAVSEPAPSSERAT